MTEEGISKLREAVRDTSGFSGKKISDLVRVYREHSLLGSVLSDSCFQLIMDILSIDKIFLKVGADAFVLELFTDMPRLTERQKSTILECVRRNYVRYENLEFCWAIGDLIARHYDTRTAVDLFGHLFADSTENGREGIALGLDVIRRRSGFDKPLLDTIKIIMNPNS